MYHFLIKFLIVGCVSTASFLNSFISSSFTNTLVPIPQWVLEDWANRTNGEGIWITDNTSYMGENEPFEAYGLQWTYGNGNSHIKGRLYMIQDGKDVGDVWQFTEYWDPALGELRVMQIGNDGTLGQGKVWRNEEGIHLEQMTYVVPDGKSFISGHHMWMEDGAHHTQSFDIVNGIWEKQRFYKWHQKSGVNND